MFLEVNVVETVLLFDDTPYSLCIVSRSLQCLFLIHHVAQLHANSTWKLGNTKLKLQTTLTVLYSSICLWVIYANSIH